MLKDRYDLPLSTDSPAARDAYVEGTDAILAATPGPEAALERAIEADPGFALPHAALARQHQLMGRVAQARAAAGQARALARDATARERQHVEIFHRMVHGKGQEALALTREHVREWPLDAFVLAPSCGVFGLVGFSGRIDREPEQLALLEPLVGAYGDDWWFLSAYAFALLETGEWSRGRTLVERSLEQFPRNAHAAHIRAHALYEGGEDALAKTYLEGWLPEYPREGLMHCHLWWHLALMRLVAGDVEGMWQAWEAHCAPEISQSPSINVMSDGVALLWRAELAGIPRDSARWRRLRDYYEKAFGRPMVFIDAHGGLPYAALGEREGLERFVAQVEELAGKGRLPAGSLGATLTRAFAAFARGDWGETIRLLEPVRNEVVRIGGSRAQRDLVRNTLLAAYVRDGRPEAARALLAAVEDRRPSVPVAGLAA